MYVNVVLLLIPLIKYIKHIKLNILSIFNQ